MRWYVIISLLAMNVLLGLAVLLVWIFEPPLELHLVLVASLGALLSLLLYGLFH